MVYMVRGLLHSVLMDWSQNKMTFNTNNRNNKVAGEVARRHYRQKRTKLQNYKTADDVFQISTKLNFC